MTPRRLLERDGVRLDCHAQALLVSGDVDFDVAALLAEKGTAWLVDQPPETRVTLDLRGVERVSSAALSVLLEWTRRARSAGVAIVSVRLSPPLARLTRVAGLDALLPVESSQEGG